jgi:hypothetical protein
VDSFSFDRKIIMMVVSDTTKEMHPDIIGVTMNAISCPLLSGCCIVSYRIVSRLVVYVGCRLFCVAVTYYVLSLATVGYYVMHGPRGCY